MKLAVGLPHYGMNTLPEILARVAHEAERLDPDSVWALKRLLRPANPCNATYKNRLTPEYYARIYDTIEPLPTSLLRRSA